MISSLAWPIVSLVLIVLANIRLAQYLKLKSPMNQTQYDDLNEKIRELQREVSSHSINRLR